ncbi:MAG: translesion error-prone DNA polymerase V autoproteolytic subunit [Bacteroidota bacterium]
MVKPPIPMMSNTVAAGFPSPATDYIEKEICLEEMVITNPGATFYIRVKGDSMVDACIPSGAILVVDRSIEARSGNIIVGWLDGQWCVKRMEKTLDGCILKSENAKYAPITILPETNFQVWGVVTFAIVDTQN